MSRAHSGFRVPNLSRFRIRSERFVFDCWKIESFASSMEITVVYVLTLGAIFGALVLYQTLKIINRQVQNLCIPFILKHISYPLVLVRRRGTSNMSRLHLIYLTIYITANVLCSAIGVSNWASFGERVGHLAMVNIIPLCVGGRTNLIANLFHLPLSEYGLMHRWIGRVCVMEGITYGVVTLTQPHTSATKYKVITVCLLCMCLQDRLTD